MKGPEEEEDLFILHSDLHCPSVLSLPRASICGVFTRSVLQMAAALLPSSSDGGGVSWKFRAEGSSKAGGVRLSSADSEAEMETNRRSFEN